MIKCMSASIGKAAGASSVPPNSMPTSADGGPERLPTMSYILERGLAR